MLRRVHTLMGAKLHAVDGDMGQIDDFYFDDHDWTVRYMIVRTGSWFSGKHVMLSFDLIRNLAWDGEGVYVDLTQEQIKNSPDLDLEKPVTREQEMELARHYHWPSYWSTPAEGTPDLALANMGTLNPTVPIPAGPGTTSSQETSADTEKSDSEVARAAQARGLRHLRGVKAVTGYHLSATDGEIGHVEDFFVDEDSRRIHYLLVDTGNWLPGRKVLISNRLVEGIDWADSRVRVNLTRDQVQQSPDYDPRNTIDRPYEERLHEHYDLPPYWL